MDTLWFLSGTFGDGSIPHGWHAWRGYRRDRAV